jgi:DNA-binding transcriptional LysR family regulator
MVLNNRYVELISEGFDMAIRVGELEDSLRARKITETTQAHDRLALLFPGAWPPERIDDLNEHKLLHYSNQPSGNVWKITAPRARSGRCAAPAG